MGQGVSHLGRWRMPSAAFLTFPLPTPPLKEQHTIVAYLDQETAEMDALITEQEELISLLKQKRSAIISETVCRGLDPTVPMKDSGVEWLGLLPKHWTTPVLKLLATKIGSGKTPRGGSEIYQITGVMFLRSQNIYDEGLWLDEVAYISHEVDEEMAASSVLPYDLLLNITGGSIGRSCVYPYSDKRANVNQHVCIIRLIREKINVKFAHYFLCSFPGKTTMRHSYSGANREGLNFDQIGNFKIPLPPLSEQQTIVDYLDHETAEIDHLIADCETGIQLLKQRRTSLISEAVTGKIDVRTA